MLIRYENKAFQKTNKDEYTILFKNGVTVTLKIPSEKEIPVIEQLQALFCSSSAYLKVYATYFNGKEFIDITEQFTGIIGDYVVCSAEELADFLYKAKEYTPINY